MTLKEILYGVACAPYDGDTSVSHITIDSRNVEKNSAFICIKGLKSDGHDYIEQCIDKGATAIICSDIPKVLRDGITYVKLTEDTRLALSKIAANFYSNPSKSLKILGVTGTNGKTSYTYFMEAVLNFCGKKVGVIGTTGARFDGKNLDIHYATSTTPDTIELHQILRAMRDLGAEYVVMEVSSHALELLKLEGIHFAAGVFTNLTQDHLDFHNTMENYSAAKAKLFSMCDFGVVNADDSYADYFLQQSKCKTITYGINAPCDYKAENLNLSATGIEYDLIYNSNKRLKFTLPVPGKFTVYNTLSVIVTAFLLGLPMEDIHSALSKIPAVPGRIQSVTGKNPVDFAVIVDYAHTPDGLLNILSSVREFTKNRVITVFGCGGDRDTKKRPQMGQIAGDLSDFCIITSDNPRSENPDDIIKQIEPGVLETGCEYIKIADRKSAIFEAVKMAGKGDSIVIAGKGHENYQEFENKRKTHFDDCEVAREALDILYGTY